ncbi:hypothetical protein K438DRAFT_1770907 [Mycena galopus ATCC 62051]|nr:hypothetical protein K438DRAFT_1770907 [Mycena galopus ATCC 62051]
MTKLTDAADQLIRVELGHLQLVSHLRGKRVSKHDSILPLARTFGGLRGCGAGEQSHIASQGGDDQSSFPSSYGALGAYSSSAPDPDVVLEKRVHWSHSAPELLGGKERNATEPPRTSDFRPATDVLTIPSLHLSSTAAMPTLSSGNSVIAELGRGSIDRMRKRRMRLFSAQGLSPRLFLFNRTVEAHIPVPQIEIHPVYFSPLAAPRANLGPRTWAYSMPSMTSGDDQALMWHALASSVSNRTGNPVKLLGAQIPQNDVG